MTRKVSILIVGAMAVCAMTSAPVMAQTNLVTNPSFETGSLSGWTNTDPSPTNNRVTTSSAAPDGSYFASLGSFSTNPLYGINQTITTTAGQSYSFSFYVRGDALDQNYNPSNQFQAYFGNQKVYDVTNLTNTGFHQQSYTVTASSASTNIRFLVNDQANFIGLDQVVVRAAGAAPEPSTWALMILGFGMAGYALRRRRVALAIA